MLYLSAESPRQTFFPQQQSHLFLILSVAMNDHDRQQRSETRSIEGSGENSNKRKSRDGSTPHTRSKRNRYISIAWYGFHLKPFPFILLIQ